MEPKPNEIVFTVGSTLSEHFTDMWKSQFNTANFWGQTLEVIRSDLEYLFDLRADDLILVNGTPVSRWGYELEYGDEVRIILGGRRPSEPQQQATPRLIVDESAGTIRLDGVTQQAGQ